MFSIKSIFIKNCLALFGTLYICQLHAQQKNNIKNNTTYTKLKEVIITGIITDKKLADSPENIMVLPIKALTTNNSINYENILNKVPGVFMQSGALNTNRITIRGIGARSPFGTTSIRAYFGDIPLTDGNGVSSIEDVDLATVASIEIQKGPSASSFGVGLGGVVLLNPKTQYNNGLNTLTESVYGGFGLFKNSNKITYATKKLSAGFAYSNTKSDGYRDNNTYNRESYTATTSLKLSKKNELLFLGNYTNLKAFIPSSVNLETFNNNPRSAAFTWGRSQGFEDFQSFLAGITWQHRFSDELALHTSVFSSGKKNYEPRPFNILDEAIKGYGLRSRLVKTSNKISWGFGGELFYDTNTYGTFENLYEDFPVGTGSVLGAKLADYKENRNYVNLFGEFSYVFHKNWLIDAGFNINKTNYKLTDNFNVGDSNQSGDFDFDMIVSPKIGIVYKTHKNISLKASVAHGFAPPTTEETLLPDGVINTNLKPEKGWNFELGSNFSFFENRLFGNVSVYSLQVNDLLVDRRGENEALFAINAGKTTHFGIESNLHYTIYASNKMTINGFINGSIYNYKFDDFIDLTDNFSGNTLTGVPSEVFNTGIDMESSVGFYGNANFQYVGSIFADDANTVSTDAYQLMNAKVGYQTSIKKQLSIDLYLGVNNLFNQKYVAQLQVNASSFGGNAPRYFYAGNPVNYYGGVKIAYQFL